MTSIIRRLKARLLRTVLAACAAFIALIGVGFLVAAAYMALLRVLSPVLSAVVFGVGWLLIALIVWAISRSISGRRHRRTKPPPEEDVDALLSAVLDPDTRAWARGHSDRATLIALVVGAAFGASPPLRRLASKLAMSLARGGKGPQR